MAFTDMADTTTTSRTVPTGRHGRKVKTGCKTCRSRKVKCDEARPACQKCISTGRRCDGYGIWTAGKDLSIVARADTTPPSSITSNPKRIHGTVYEQLYFTWYARKSVLKLPGLFTSDFWGPLVVQVSLEEPAVRHAVLVLGSAHVSDIYERETMPDEQAVGREKFMLQQYSAAIGRLHPLLGRQDPASMRIVLIACLLFVYAELLRDRVSTAWVHLSGAAQALHALQSHPSSKDDSNTADLSEVFLKLQVQFQAMRKLELCQPLTSDRGISSSGDPYTDVRSAQQARHDLDTSLRAIQQLTTQGAPYRLDARLSVPPSLLAQQRRLLSSIGLQSHWTQTARTTCQRLGQIDGYFSYLILDMYFLMALIDVSICLSPSTTALLTPHTSTFRAILSRACEMWSTLASGIHQRRRYGDEHKSGSISDIGWILPLYFVGVHCRQHDLRAQAIRMVRLSPHREGVWDATQAAMVARRIMQIEEGSMSDEKFDDVDEDLDVTRGCSPPDARRRSWPLLPDKHWVHEVKMLVADGDRDALIVSYKTQQPDGTWVDNKTYFNKATSTWT